jgi:small-conductance mechanosensitive channel
MTDRRWAVKSKITVSSARKIQNKKWHGVKIATLIARIFPRPLLLLAACKQVVGWLSAVRRIVAICSLAGILSPGALAQPSNDHTSQSPEDSHFIPSENSGVPVEIDGRPILMIYAQIGGFTPQERAAAIQQRIVALAKRRYISPEAIRAEERGTWTEIMAGDERIMGVTEADAIAAERRRSDIASEHVEIIRLVVKQYRLDHTWQRFFWAVLRSVLATAVVVGAIIILFRIRRGMGSRVDHWLGGSEIASPAPSARVWLKRYLGQPLVTVGHAGFWVVVLALIQTYGTVVLSFFPATKYTSDQITNWLFYELAVFAKMVIGYIPNLILILIICLVTSYLLKVNHYLFNEVRDGNLTVHGFYPDWAEPTAKLVRCLIIVAAAIVAFPYLPGSESPAFKGISVFLGVLLSLGSTSAVAHGVAGTILTYMRAFQVGDFVRIGNDVGEVVEKTLLVTRICTQKREVVTIPNGTVLGGVVVNYSAEAKQKGVIFHTTVTIGYSAPWRKVHELLLAAALVTDDVLHDPPPFVLQTALNDFYVAYELNAYTAKPSEMLHTYSVLHQNIQDRFNEAGVEINSPHYRCLRDGNQATIPESYLPSDYKTPVFEIAAQVPFSTPSVDRTSAASPLSNPKG